MNVALEGLYKGIEEVKQIEAERDRYKARCVALGDKLLNAMMDIYNMTSFEDRKKQHQTRMCSHCRKRFECNGDLLGEDVMKPMMYYGGIPDYTWCEHYDWDD